MFETKGTILIAPEGINGTIEGSKNNIKKFLETLKKCVTQKGKVLKVSTFSRHTIQNF